MRGRPGAIRHNNVNLTADTTIEFGEEVPVSFFEGAAEAFSCAGIEALISRRGGVVEGGQHVGGDGGVVYVGACGDGGEEEFGEGEGEGVAHCVDEDVGHEEGESIVGEDERAERLAEEGETGVGGAEDVIAGGEVEEDDCWGMEFDVEAILLHLSTSRRC